MSARGRSALSTLLILGALSGSLIAVAAPGRSGAVPPVNLPALSAVAPKDADEPAGASTESPRPANDLEVLSYRATESGLVADMPDGTTAELTLDAGLQAHLEGVLRRYEVPYGAVVAMEPASGRVLAYVSHSSANPDAGDLARNA